MPDSIMVPEERVDRTIIVLRGQKVILDAELAVLYGVETRVLLQSVRRNIERFPADFMFQLTAEEAECSRSRSIILSADGEFVAAPLEGRTNSKRGQNIKYLPYAFTQEGVAMLSSVLRSSRAVQVNIEIMRAFVRLRQMLRANADLCRKVEVLEKKYDSQFKVVFDAIRRLMEPPEKTTRRIGFSGD
jgi:phage regulator Rha-like protein